MNPIYIHKGDSTTFADVTKFLTFNIETDLDLTGWTAKFTLDFVTKEINDISTKSFDVILTAQDTKRLRTGVQYGSIILTDENGNIKTIVNTIPFQVTNEVIENGYQEIDLTIPESSGVDLKLRVGSRAVTSINGKYGDVILTAQDVGALPNTTIIPDVSGLATKQELTSGLATKQAKGDYALKSEIPSLEGLASEEQLEQGLNTKQDKGNYALKSDIPSLDDYVKNTDLATNDNAGVVKTGSGLGIMTTSSGALYVVKSSNSEIDDKKNNYKVIVPSNLNYAVNSVLPTMTQAQYDALKTKDENLFYMIVEG